MTISREHCAALAEAQVVTSTTNGEYAVRLSSLRKSVFDQAITSASGQTPQQQQPHYLPSAFLALARKAAKDSPEELAVLEICASLANYTEHMLNGFIEMASKLVQHKMVFQLMEELESCVRETVEGSIGALFPVDAVAVRKKAELEAKIEKLQQVKNMLSSLQSGGPPFKRART